MLQWSLYKGPPGINPAESVFKLDVIIDRMVIQLVIDAIESHVDIIILAEIEAMAFNLGSGSTKDSLYMSMSAPGAFLMRA